MMNLISTYFYLFNDPMYGEEGEIFNGIQQFGKMAVVFSDCQMSNSLNWFILFLFSLVTYNK